MPNATTCNKCGTLHRPNVCGYCGADVDSQRAVALAAIVAAADRVRRTFDAHLINDLGVAHDDLAEALDNYAELEASE